ncbi:MAG: beta-N-acetylhexosaminidase [Leadbetterella sp.]
MNYFKAFCVGFILWTNIIYAQSLIPYPTFLEKGSEQFVLQNSYVIKYPPLLTQKAKYLIKNLEEAVDLTIYRGIAQKKESIDLEIIKYEGLGNEGYLLQIYKDGISIKAQTEAGILYGITTLIQLVYEYRDFGPVSLPYLKVKDVPKYPFRSFMMDAGRYYHTIPHLKKYLNEMAMLKLNVFHWHLTDNEGWRIESKKYPKLHQIGAYVFKKPEDQGYYTQAEIKEIIRYAKELNIDVIPEIDVPGHAEAILHSYPEIQCFGEKPSAYKGHHSPHILCGGKPKTYEMMKGILDEVCALFPSQYIHLGGDEAPKENWDKCPHCQAKIKSLDLKNTQNLQLHFSRELALHLQKKGRKAIFWDDVVDGGDVVLPQNTVIEWWNYRSKKDMGYKRAIELGYELICNTNYYTYLYFPVTAYASTKENRTFDIKQCYTENPSDIKNPPQNVIGMSACQWGDDNMQQYMNDRRIFPRIYALAEQMWGTGERATFDVFYDRVKSKKSYMVAKGIQFGPALREEVPKDYKWGEATFMKEE